jgi:hypothetical protein
MTRTKITKVRLTEDEHRRLKASAGKRGVSAFLRLCALGKDQREQKSEALRVVAELARIRNLLVLVAQNSVRRPSLDQILIVSQLVNVERELSRIPRA